MAAPNPLRSAPRLIDYAVRQRRVAEADTSRHCGGWWAPRRPFDFEIMCDKSTVSEELLARCLGSLDLVQRVLDAYATQMEEDIPRLVSELEEGHSSDVARIAHRIKGASANAAVETLRSDAEEIERLARAAQLNQASSRVHQLKQDWSAYLKSISSPHSSPDP